MDRTSGNGKLLLTLLLAVSLLSACNQQTPAQSANHIGASSETTWQERYDLGMRYLTEGNYAEAIIAFTAAIEIDPKQAPAYVGRGQAYIFSSETEKNLAAAQTDFEKAVETDDTNSDAYLGLADIHIRRGEYDTALKILQGGLEKTGQNSAIADKIAEMESDDIADLSDKAYQMDKSEEADSDTANPQKLEQVALTSERQYATNIFLRRHRTKGVQNRARWCRIKPWTNR